MVKAIVLTLLATLMFAMPAAACGTMQKADPKVGSIVQSPSRVQLTFSEAVVPDSSTVNITDEAGRTVPVGRAMASSGDTVLSVTTPSLAPGKYKVRWDVLWLDCHMRTSGDYKFTVQSQ